MRPSKRRTFHFSVWQPSFPEIHYSDIHYFGGRIRLVVVNQLPVEEQNAMLHMYSTKGELLSCGVEHYRQRVSTISEGGSNHA
jgi:hypothetical protein